MNAVSYVAVIASILMLRRSEMVPVTSASRTGKPVREALRFVWNDVSLRYSFIVFIVVSTFAFNYSVVLPKLSDQVWNEPNGYAILLSMTSLGSIVGALATARFRNITISWYASMLAICGISCIAMGFAPNFYVACVVAIPLGLGGTGLVAAMTGITQQKVSSEMRGRMMALQSVAFLGSTPIGGPITGWIGDHISIRWSIAYGGVLALMSLPLLRRAQ
jgi:MFS family permease